mmetsp:Transcript_9315/g.13923  ORF Transcript_9315/g.13923 Transcript_9315/m.13923 type:complete len:94 (-) Transcript_9315:108-389(-)
MNPNKAKFAPNSAREDALARNPAHNNSINALGCPDFVGSPDPNHKKRKNRQIDSGGSQKNNVPNKARIEMRMKIIERHGQKTRIVMEPCLVDD